MGYRPVTGDDVASVSIPAPPRHCGCSGCGNGTDILLVIVRKNGHETCGTFGEFCEESWSGKACHRTEKPGVEFIEWLARCSDCYQRDLLQQRKSRDDYLLDPVAIRARLAKPRQPSVLAGFAPLTGLLGRLLRHLRPGATP